MPISILLLVLTSRRWTWIWTLKWKCPVGAASWWTLQERLSSRVVCRLLANLFSLLHVLPWRKRTLQWQTCSNVTPPPHQACLDGPNESIWQWMLDQLGTHLGHRHECLGRSLSAVWKFPEETTNTKKTTKKDIANSFSPSKEKTTNNEQAKEKTKMRW